MEPVLHYADRTKYALRKEETMTKKELQKQLSDMGLQPTDTLLMHSSMKAIGEVEGGAGEHQCGQSRV